MVTAKLNISVTPQEEKGHCIQSQRLLSDLADKSKAVILFNSSVLSG